MRVPCNIPANPGLRVIGDLSTQAQAEFQPSFRVTSSMRWSNAGQLVFNEGLDQTMLNAGPLAESFESVFRADPAMYRFVVESTAGVTDANPVTGSFHATADSTVELFHLADLDLSGVGAVQDLLMLLSQWGPCPTDCMADIDGDDVVNVDDLLALFAAWGAIRP